MLSQSVQVSSSPLSPCLRAVLVSSFTLTIILRILNLRFRV